MELNHYKIQLEINFSNYKAWMSNFLRHSYHLVDESPWPILSSVSAFYITLGIVFWFQSQQYLLIRLGLISLLMTSYQWWRDVNIERCYQGRHRGIVELGLRWGILLFIVSEVFFFLSFFWAFFHISLAPRVELGNRWAPIGIEVLNPLDMPLLNTVILVVSGISVTWSHHRMIENNHNSAVLSLIITVILGVIFTLLQAFEYYEVRFSIRDRVFGRVFFIATGFHGLHVIIGTLFLLISLTRLLGNNFRAIHHFGFEARVWYWHFVDVVWLFLYLFIYWWRRLYLNSKINASNLGFEDT